MVRVLLRRRDLKMSNYYVGFTKSFDKNVKSNVVAILKDATQLLIS